MKKPTVVMLSDFGIDSGLVACMHGMCHLVDPELETYDITHLIPAFDIEAASYCLQYTVPFWPNGTVFVSVVDPGVGTSRKACVAKLKNGSYVVTPDNGTLTYLNKRIGVEEIREINEEINRYPLTKDVHTFHGRDLFAYCAARLASGIISFEEVGPTYSVTEIVCHELKCASISEGVVETEIKSYDPFGSAELTVENKEFEQAGFTIGDKVRVILSDKDETVLDTVIPYEKSFGYVPKGEDVMFNDLASYVTIASNEASFQTKYHLNPEINYHVRLIKE